MTEVKDLFDTVRSKLSEEQYAAIKGVYVDGLTQWEVANQLGYSQRNVGNLIVSALARLRNLEYLKELGEWAEFLDSQRIDHAILMQSPQRSVRIRGLRRTQDDASQDDDNSE